MTTAESLQVFKTVKDLRACVKSWRYAGLTVGLVPTMGALHDGHMALVKAAYEICDRVIVTVFVNPNQFGPSEDFDAYPRDEAKDIECAKAHGVHALFAPNADEMYAKGEMTAVKLEHYNTLLEGLSRPGHFDGVALVVTKLLNQAQADHAFFGEKDYQQLQVISHSAQDLCIPTEIHGVKTIRESDGLAFSSRNVYFSANERAQAPILFNVLTTIAKGFLAGKHAGRLELYGRETLAQAGFGPIDYLVVADANTLQPLNSYDPARAARVLCAVKLGATRLIDNVPVE